MTYRREIDGLRAVAVLPVMGFHAGAGLLPGGFVGVDVFFVLSGYLITAILLEDLSQDRFSLWRFYERRARRILPALFLVMAATLPFAWAWMLPDQAQEFGQSLIAVAFFASNILFWRQDGYFDAPAELKPMLHTWSLAVEEQFYLLFPLVLFALWRLGARRVIWVLAGLTLASLALSEIGSRWKPAANFYLAPTRAWELLAGSLCACLTRDRNLPRHDGLAGLGLALILVAMLGFDSSTRIPGLAALLPVGGTVLVVLFATQGSRVARLLSIPPLVGVGLISYSAYLWHQPLFALARLRSDGEPGAFVMAGLAAATLALAAVSWKFVEQPFRRKSGLWLPERRQVFLASGLGMALFTALGLWAWTSGGWPGRLPQDLQAATRLSQPISRDCGAKPQCEIGEDGGQPTGLVFVGDSHMGRYAWLLHRQLEERGLRAGLVTQPYCAPVLDYLTEDRLKNAEACRDLFQPAFRAALSDPSVTTLVLAGDWPLYATGWRPMSGLSAYDHPGDGQVNRDADQNPAEFSRAWAAMLAEVRAAGKRLVVVKALPEYDFLVPGAVINNRRFGRDLSGLDRDRAAHEARNAEAELAFQADVGGTGFIDPALALCDDLACRPYDAAGLPLYNDNTHLGEAGLGLVVPLILDGLGLKG